MEKRKPPERAVWWVGYMASFYVSSQKVGARQLGEHVLCSDTLKPSCLAPT